MATIADLSDLINLSTNGGVAPAQNSFFFKVARIAGAAPAANIAGRPCSLWRYDGTPGAGTVPGAVEVPTNATAGALPFVSPTGGREAWLTQAWATGLVGGTLILYDRLLHVGGLSGIVTTAQTVGGALTRHTDGVGNFIMVEMYALIGTTARTVTAAYTSTTDLSENTVAVAMGGTGFREDTRAILLPLTSGDIGVKAVASVTLSASTGTAGNFGITVGNPVAYLACGAPGAPGWRDFLTGMPGIPKLESGSCLSMLWVPATVTAPEIFGGFGIVEK